MIRFSTIYWDPNPEALRIPYFDWPIFWYGIVFALGFIFAFPLFVFLLRRFLGGEKKLAVDIADSLTIYIVIATVIGARLGHFLFYERPEVYLKRPIEILQIWEGGLASHGAVIAILFALWLFSKKARKIDPRLGWTKLLDLLAPPAALVGFFIRIGNFINQEILGTVSNMPWAVIYGHPMDRSLPLPRHPVVLYEAFFYLAVFFLLFALAYKERFLKKKGFFIGVFLISVFSFRFFIEVFKEKQSHLLTSFPLTMGQILSIPMVFLGIFFLLAGRSKKGSFNP